MNDQKKSKWKKKHPETMDDLLGGVTFRLEDDAAEIFREYVDTETIPQFDDEEESEIKQASKRKEEKLELVEVDLHGMTVKEAKAKLNKLMDQLFTSEHSAVKLKVITGKGRHSGPEGGTLVKEIYSYFKNSFQENIKKIESDPSLDLINGLPLKGHFDCELKF